jgi:hypothetical protein
MADKSGSPLVGTELDVEHLARTVACPNCGAPPLAPCRYALFGGVRNQSVSQLGRLVAARGAS